MVEAKIDIECLHVVMPPRSCLTMWTLRLINQRASLTTQGSPSAGVLHVSVDTRMGGFLKIRWSLQASSGSCRRGNDRRGRS